MAYRKTFYIFRSFSGIKELERSSKLVSTYGISSAQFGRSVVSNPAWPHGLKHTRPPCPSSSPKVYSNSCPLSWWCHPTISSSVIPFFWLQSFPPSGSFQMNQVFTLDDQSIGPSASASVLPMNIQDWFPLGWNDWISLPSKGLSRVWYTNVLFLSFSISMETSLITWDSSPREEVVEWATLA